MHDDIPSEPTISVAQHRADILLSHWRNLWPLPTAERIKLIQEIDLDIRFEELLHLVTAEMTETSVILEINPWAYVIPIGFGLLCAIEAVVQIAVRAL